jgi:hypothetical protein
MPNFEKLFLPTISWKKNGTHVLRVFRGKITPDRETHGLLVW